jgi:hypothetical protein
MKTFLEMLLEASQFLDAASSNEQITKEELIMSMENRISVMVSKAVTAPMGGNFSVFEAGSG